MDTKELPDIEYIRECVDYDPETGVFTWRKRPLHHFPCEVAQKWWNTKFAGKLAGSGTNSRQNYWRLCLGKSHIKAHRIAWLGRRGNSARFNVHVAVNGKKHWVGAFTTLDEAASARRIAAERLHGKFARHD